jgi:hypothetical protein
VYATYAPAARTAPRPSVERLPQIPEVRSREAGELRFGNGLAQPSLLVGAWVHLPERCHFFQDFRGCLIVLILHSSR